MDNSFTIKEFEQAFNLAWDRRFTYNYNGVSNKTHPKLIEQVIASGMKVLNSGKEFNPIMVTQIDRATAIVSATDFQDELAKNYIDKYYSDTLIVSYKLEVQLTNKIISILPLDLQNGKLTRPWDISILKVIVLYPALVGFSTIPASQDAYRYSYNFKEKQQAEVIAAQKMANGLLPEMGLPFINTEYMNFLTSIVKANTGSSLIDPKNIEELNFRYANEDVTEKVMNVIHDKYKGLHCKECSNAIICMLAKRSKPSWTSAYVCMLTTLKKIKEVLNIEKTTTPELLLLASTDTKDPSKMIVYNSIARLIVELLMYMDRDEDAIVSLIENNGLRASTTNLSMYHLAKDSLVGKAIHSIPLAGIEGLTSSVRVNSKRVTKVMPECYDSRKAVEQQHGQVYPNTKEFETIILNVIKHMLQRESDIHTRASARYALYELKQYRDSISLTDEELLDKLKNVILKLLVTKDDRVYIQHNDDSRYSMLEYIAKTTANIQSFFKDPQHIKVNLKEFQTIKSEGLMKISTVLATAHATLEAMYYNSTERQAEKACVKQGKYCCLSNSAEKKSMHIAPEMCSASCTNTNILASIFAITQKKRNSYTCYRASPCNGNIHDAEEVVKKGRMLMEQQISNRYSMFETATKVMAVWIYKYLKNMHGMSCTGTSHRNVMLEGITVTGRNAKRKISDIALYVGRKTLIPIMYPRDVVYKGNAHEQIMGLLRIVNEETAVDMMKQYLEGRKIKQVFKYNVAGHMVRGHLSMAKATDDYNMFVINMNQLKGMEITQQEEAEVYMIQTMLKRRYTPMLWAVLRKENNVEDIVTSGGMCMFENMEKETRQVICEMIIKDSVLVDTIYKDRAEYVKQLLRNRTWLNTLNNENTMLQDSCFMGLSTDGEGTSIMVKQPQHVYGSTSMHVEDVSMQERGDGAYKDIAAINSPELQAIIQKDMELSEKKKYIDMIIDATLNKDIKCQYFAVSGKVQASIGKILTIGNDKNDYAVYKRSRAKIVQAQRKAQNLAIMSEMELEKAETAKVMLAGYLRKRKYDYRLETQLLKKVLRRLQK